MEDNIEISAKLKIDTSEAESKINALSNKANKSKNADSKIKIPKETTKSLKDLFSGDKGLGNIGKLAKSATGGVKQLAGSLSGMAGGAGKAALALGVVAAVIATVVKLISGTDTALAMAEKFRQFFDLLRQTLAPVLSLLGDLVIVIIQIAKDLLPLLKPAVDAVALALKPIVAVFQLIEPVVNALSKAFEAFYDVLREVLKIITFGLIDLDAMTGSTAVQKAGYKSSLDAWEVSGDTAREQLTETKKGNDIADKSYNLLESFKSSLSEIGNTFRKVFDWTNGFFDKLWQGTSNVLSGLFSKAKGFGGGLFTSQGRWGNGYQFGDVTGSVFDFFAGLFGKGWLWADGGTLDIGAQVWGMNEKGNPEFMFNAGGHDTVINSQILENAMYNAVKRAGLGEAKDIQITMDGSRADARQLVKWLLPALKLEWR